MTKKQKKLNDELIKASEYGEIWNVIQLIQHGAEITARNNQGCTPLHLASWLGHTEVVKYLIEKGAEVDARDTDWATPLHWAAELAKLEVVKYLIRKGAEDDARNKYGRTPLFKATDNIYPDVVKYLFLERNALMPIKGLFKYPDVMKEKMGRETEAQSIFDYFLQNKSNYRPEEIQDFKTEFLKFKMNEQDTLNLKSIVRFL